MLSITSEHAIRALLCLARIDHGRPVLLRELAGCASVPTSYLSKILGSLTRAGLLRATRGVNGGYQMKRAAHDIPLLEIVEIFDGPQGEPFCIFSRHDPCSHRNPCPAHKDWKKVRDAYLSFLKSKTLADLAGLPSVRTKAAREQAARRKGAPRAERNWK